MENWGLGSAQTGTQGAIFEGGAALGNLVGFVPNAVAGEALKLARAR